MAWLALLPGRLLERIGNGAPRGMVAHDRTRLIGRLPTSSFAAAYEGGDVFTVVHCLAVPIAGYSHFIHKGRGKC